MLKAIENSLQHALFSNFEHTSLDSPFVRDGKTLNREMRRRPLSRLSPLLEGLVKKMKSSHLQKRAFQFRLSRECDSGLDLKPKAKGPKQEQSIGLPEAIPFSKVWKKPDIRGLVALVIAE
jgi:hypothetical protein